MKLAQMVAAGAIALLLAGCGGTPDPAKAEPTPPTDVATPVATIEPGTTSEPGTTTSTETVDTSMATQLARFRGHWELVEVEGLHPDTKTAGVTLQIEPASLSGFVGCSQFAGKAVLTGIQLEVTNWTSERLNGCHRVYEEAEDGFSTFMADHPHLEFQDEELIVVTGPDGKIVLGRAGQPSSTASATQSNG